MGLSKRRKSPSTTDGHTKPDLKVSVSHSDLEACSHLSELLLHCSCADRDLLHDPDGGNADGDYRVGLIEEQAFRHYVHRVLTKSNYNFTVDVGDADDYFNVSAALLQEHVCVSPFDGGTTDCYGPNKRAVTDMDMVYHLTKSHFDLDLMIPYFERPGYAGAKANSVTLYGRWSQVSICSLTVVPLAQ